VRRFSSPGSIPSGLRPLLIVLAAVAALGGCLHRPPAPPPALKAGEAADVSPQLDNYSRATLPRDGSIVVAGDGFVASAKPGPKARKAPPKTLSLADALAEATSLKIVDQTRPGDTLAAGAARVSAGPPGALLVICFGYGDAAAKTTPAAFQSGLEQMIRLAHRRGAAVYVVAEPATTLKDSTAAEPFRAVVRLIGATEGAGVIDAPPALATAALGPSPTRVQPAAAVRLLAGLVSQYIRLAPPAGPS